jgi:ribosomal protein L37AE/L43A
VNPEESDGANTMREKLMRFMVGRNGNDQLNLFLYAVDAVLLIAATLIGGQVGRWMWVAVLALLGYIYFRMFSRNLTKRREENGKFLRMLYSVQAGLKIRREKWVQRKDYKFFTCPSCKTTLRVPRGNGKIKIVCRKCGNSFTGKS